MITRLLARRRDAEPREDGFMLLEAVISISLIVIIMSALTTFFVTAGRSTTELVNRIVRMAAREGKPPCPQQD